MSLSTLKSAKQIKCIIIVVISIIIYKKKASWIDKWEFRKKNLQSNKRQESLEQLGGPVTWPSNDWVFLLKGGSRRGDLLCLLCRGFQAYIAGHLPPLAAREKETTKPNKGSLTQMMQGFIFRSASTSVKETHEYVSMENRGREKDGQIDRRGETTSKPTKGRTCGMDDRRVKLQGSGWPSAPPTLPRRPAGTLTFLYESSIVGSYFSTKIPWTNWTVCEKRTETTSRLTSDQISRDGTKWAGRKSPHSPLCSEWPF